MARGTRAHPSDSPLQALEDKKKNKAPRRKAQPLTKASKASTSVQTAPSLAAPSATSQSDEGPESDSVVAPESRSTSPSIKARHNTRSTTRSVSRSISPSNIINHGKRTFNQVKAATLPRSRKLSKNNTSYTGIGKRTRSQMSVAPEIVPADDDADNHYEPRANDADDESRPPKRVRQTNVTNPSPFSSSTQNQLTPSIEHADALYDHPVSSEEEQDDDQNEEYVSTGTVVKDEARGSGDESVEDFQSTLDRNRRSNADESMLSSPSGSSTPRPLTPKNNSQYAATFAAPQNVLDTTPTGPASRLLPPTTAEFVRKSLAEKPLPTDPVERRKEILDRFDTDIPAPNDKIRKYFASPSDRAAAAAEAEDDMDESLSMISFDVPQPGKRRNIIQENAAFKSNLSLENKLLEKNKAQRRERKKLQEEQKKHEEKSAALNNRMETLKSQLHVPATAFCPSEKTLTRVDIIDATHSIVQWTESDPTNPVPSPQQLLDLLEEFKARELVKTANPTANLLSSSAEDITIIHHRDEAEEHASHVTEATQIDDHNDRSSFMMVNNSEDPFVSPTVANGETSASGMSLAISQPTTPTNRNNIHKQSRLWNTISRVTDVVSSPFKFLAGRNQTVSGPANDTPGLTSIASSQQRGILNPPKLPPTTPNGIKKTLRAPRTRTNPVPQNRRTKSGAVPHSMSWKKKNLSPQAQKEADARAELLDEQYFQEQQKKLNATQTGERSKKRNAYTAYVEEGDDEDNENPLNVTLKEAGQRVGEKRKRANTPGTFGFSYSDDESSSSGDDDSNVEKDPFMHTTKSGITFRINTDGRRKFATDDEGNQYRVDCWNNPYKHKMKPTKSDVPHHQHSGSFDPWNGPFDPWERAPSSIHDSEAREVADRDYWKQLYMVQSSMRPEERVIDNRVRKRSGYDWATDHRLSGGYLAPDGDYYTLMGYIEFQPERALEMLAEEQSREHEHRAFLRREDASRRLEDEATAIHSTYKYPSVESEEEEDATSSQHQDLPPSSPRPAKAVLPAATPVPITQPQTATEAALAKILRYKPETPTPLAKVWEMSPSYKDDFKENHTPFKGFSPTITAAVNAAPSPENPFD